MANWKKNTTLTYEGENEIEFNSANLGNFYIGKPSPMPEDAKRVGGRIFYGHFDNQANYRFFTRGQTEITDWSIPEGGGLPIGLDNAYYYTSDKAEGVADRFYVFDNINGLQIDKQWGKYKTQIGKYKVAPYKTDGIGQGKINTKACLDAYDDWEDNSIFAYIKSCNENKLLGCDDWYIGSKAEQNKLYTVKSVVDIDWANTGIWSSIEEDGYQSWIYSFNDEDWYLLQRNYAHYVRYYACFAMRSF